MSTIKHYEHIVLNKLPIGICKRTLTHSVLWYGWLGGGRGELWIKEGRLEGGGGIRLNDGLSRHGYLSIGRSSQETAYSPLRHNHKILEIMFFLQGISFRLFSFFFKDFIFCWSIGGIYEKGRMF